MRRYALPLLLLAIVALCTPRAFALDDEHWQKANDAINRGIAHLRTTQGEDGSWSPKPGPAVTAMVMRVMLDRPDLSPSDPAVAKALRYVLSRVKPDGGIHDGFLENYNTAISLSGLARVNDKPEAAAAIAKAQDYLRGLQWSNQNDPRGKPIDPSHPFYGGAGYGGEGRPDMSNTQIMLEGLHDSGLDCNDPAFQRALAFITRCQGTAANKEFGDKIVPDGGFIYATSRDKDHIGELESKAGEETVDIPGRGGVSLLRTYGSMTYAGFKSYLYANLDRNDPRVADAYHWIRRNYTLEGNPGLRDDPATPVNEGKQGYFYYLMTFSRALRAWGSSTITPEGGQPHDWANDLVDKLASLQKPDGSWGPNEADRWMEGDQNLVSAYALIALEEAIR